MLLCSLVATTPLSLAAAPPEPLGLTMAEATTRAVRDSPLVAAAGGRLAAAHARARSVRAMAGLQVSTGLFTSVSNQETMENGPPGFEPALSATLGRDYAVGQQVAAMFPLYTGRRLAAEVRSADAEVAASQAEFDVARASAAASAREAYLAALLADARRRVAEADQTAAHQMAQNARAEWEAGKGIEATYLRAVARERSADGDLAMAEAERGKALVRLRAAMALPADVQIEPTDTLAARRTYGSLQDALAALRHASPDVLVASRRLDAARAMVAAARGSEGPQAYAALMGGWATSRGMPARVGGSVGVTVGYPLFDGGRRREETRRARAEVDAAAAEEAGALLDAEAAVRAAWLDLTAAGSARVAAQAAVAAAVAAYEVIELRVRNQKSILVEQLDALAAVSKARLDEAQALFNEAMAGVQIERALGRY